METDQKEKSKDVTLSTNSKVHFKNDSRENIRMSSKDVHAIQVKALAEGIPYQTLISSVLHKYVTGKLKEKEL